MTRREHSMRDSDQECMSGWRLVQDQMTSLYLLSYSSYRELSYTWMKLHSPVVGQYFKTGAKSKTRLSQRLFWLLKCSWQFPFDKQFEHEMQSGQSVENVHERLVTDFYFTSEGSWCSGQSELIQIFRISFDIFWELHKLKSQWVQLYALETVIPKNISCHQFLSFITKLSAQWYALWVCHQLWCQISHNSWRPSAEWG